MADIFQNGEITTLHRLKSGGTERLERELEIFSKNRPIALVIPALFVDLKAKPIKNILSEISKVRYLNEIIISLGRANKDEFAEVKSMLSSFNLPASIIWNDGENIQKLYHMLDKENLSAGEDGKGRSAWISYGYILSTQSSQVIVLHDSDIVTYNRELLARLCYPGKPFLKNSSDKSPRAFPLPIPSLRVFGLCGPSQRALKILRPGCSEKNQGSLKTHCLPEPFLVP